MSIRTEVLELIQGRPGGRVPWFGDLSYYYYSLQRRGTLEKRYEGPEGEKRFYLDLGVGIYLNRQITTSPWLIWLGIPQIGRPMADWYPVLPWFGLVLLGITAGHSLYPSGVRRFALPDWSSAPVIRQLSFLGRHSLLIYLVHQPVLLAILTGIAWVSS